MRSPDVVVVGAGPAGSLAARHLALAGVRVLLLERATFPRDKPCGDGVSYAGLEVLARNGLGEWAAGFTAPEVLRVVAPNGEYVEVRPPALAPGECYGRTIPRRLLDARLAQSAVEAGARLQEGVRVRRVEREAAGLQVVADGLTVSAPLVILADGSLATVTRRLGLPAGETEMVAVRQYLAGDEAPAGLLELHFQRAIVPGYTWIFPLGDGRVNIGSGAFTAQTRAGGLNLREVLSRFIADQQAAAGRLARPRPLGPPRGHPLRARLGRARPYADRLLVAGDAAGLVNPLTGEGITPAMESGEIAARHAVAALKSGAFSASALAAYGRELRRRFLPDQRAARFLRLCLSSPGLLDRMVRRMQRDSDTALEIGSVIIGYRSPRTILRPLLLWRILT